MIGGELNGQLLEHNVARLVLFQIANFSLVRRVLPKRVSLTAPQITQSNVFAIVLFFVSSLPSIPLSVYQTFVLEEKHGFNKTTPGLFVADMLKGWAVGLVLAPPFLSAFLWIFKWAGDRFVPWLMAFM